MQVAGFSLHSTNNQHTAIRGLPYNCSNYFSIDVRVEQCNAAHREGLNAVLHSSLTCVANKKNPHHSPTSERRASAAHRIVSYLQTSATEHPSPQHTAGREHMENLNLPPRAALREGIAPASAAAGLLHIPHFLSASGVPAALSQAHHKSWQCHQHHYLPDCLKRSTGAHGKDQPLPARCRTGSPAQLMRRALNV